jgi:hypothetical protein
VWAIVVIGLMLGWRILAFSDTHMREDEELAFRTTQTTLTEAVRYQAEEDTQAPLWFALFWAWQQVAGKTELAGRVFSLVWTGLTLAALYRLACAMLPGRLGQRAGLGALVFAGGSAYYWVHSLEIRPYPLIMLCAVLATGAFWRWLNAAAPAVQPAHPKHSAPRERAHRAAAVYGLTMALCAVVHYFLAFLIMAHTLVTAAVGVGMVRRGGLRAGRPLAVGLFTAAVLAALLWSPWLPYFIDQMRTLSALAQAAGAADALRPGTHSTAEPTAWPTIARLIVWATNGLAWAVGGVLALGVWAAAGHTGARVRRALGTAWAWALGVPAIALVLNLAAAVYAPRYVSYLSLGVALALGMSAALVWERRPRGLRLLPVVLASALLVSLSAHIPQRPPLRNIYRAIAHEARPGDGVLFMRAGEDDGFFIWHMREYLRADLTPVTAAVLADDARLPRRVWLVTGDLFADDVQAVFRHLEPRYPVQRVIGRCDNTWCYVAQAMEAPPGPAVVFRGVDVPTDRVHFLGLDMDAIHLDADAGTYTIGWRTWWSAEARPTRDYSIAVHVLDSGGRLIAQHDGPILHYGADVIETSHIEPGRLYIDRRTLTFPADGTPVALRVRVYQSWDGARLTTDGGEDGVTAALPMR